jgi:thioredoxin-related protein
MKNLKYVLLIILEFDLFELISAEKKIIIIEGDYLDKAIQNAISSNYKLFLIFHVQKCQYCTHVLKVLKSQVIKNYEDDEKIFFGSVNLDEQSNVWLGVRFNISKIPFIILIENKKMYHFESQFEESLVVKFINEEKNVEDGEEIPPAVTFNRKFSIAVEELTQTIQGYLNKYLGTKTWSNKMTYILLVILFIGVIYIESSIINKCKNLCKFNKKVKKEDKNETNSEIKNEKNELKKKKE